MLIKWPQRRNSFFGPFWMRIPDANLIAAQRTLIGNLTAQRSGPGNRYVLIDIINNLAFF
jgi:hypothetical protein